MTAADGVRYEGNDAVACIRTQAGETIKVEKC